MIEENKKWNSLVKYISQQFGGGEELDLQAILFLIGINELGQGYRSFKKQEKIDLLHIAICKLLSIYGYYSFNGRDDEINLKTKKPEFLDWKWIDIDKITDNVVDFKREVYIKLKDEVKKVIFS